MQIIHLVQYRQKETTVFNVVAFRIGLQREGFSVIIKENSSRRWFSVVYRVDELIENKINPITGNQYDDSWIALVLTDSEDYQFLCGSQNGCAYTIKVSCVKCDDWKLSVGDFLSFNEANAKNIILAMTETDHKAVNDYYKGHSYNEDALRENEPRVLVHSTPLNSWSLIKQGGMLKELE